MPVSGSDGSGGAAIGGQAYTVLPCGTPSANTDRHRYCHSDAYGYSYCDGDGNSYSYSYVYSHTNSHSNGDANTAAEPDANSDCNGYPDTNANSWATTGGADGAKCNQ